MPANIKIQFDSIHQIYNTILRHIWAERCIYYFYEPNEFDNLMQYEVIRYVNQRQ